MSADRSREVMRRYLEEVVGNGTIELLEDIAVEDVKDHTAERAGLRPGRLGWIDHVGYFRAALPDVRVAIRRIVADDENAVGWWTATGTHSADFFGVPATGRTLQGDAVSFFELRDGKVVDYQVVVDLYPLLQQMGALPTQ